MGNVKKTVCIVGPTASGKTRLSIGLAKELKGEIISADAFLVYRGLSVGTAKPSMAEREGISHHMIDIVDPGDNYSVARYVGDASACVGDVLKRGKIPIIAGGSGLYVDSLIGGRAFAGFTPSGDTRKRLLELAESSGGDAVFELLKRHDPDSAARLHPNDLKRVIRALEVFFETGKTISEHNKDTEKEPPLFDAVTIGLDYEKRQELYDRIDARVDEMIERGLLKELEGLINTGLDRNANSMQAIGYKELFPYLDGLIDFDTAVSNIKRESRRYAKRQLTWFRQKSGIHWIKISKNTKFNDVLHSFTNYVKQNILI